MPSPPREGEKESEFMTRCMMTFKAERVPQQQALARCLKAWRERKNKDKKSV